MRLAELLAPLGIESFREGYLGRRPLVLLPAAGTHRFADLATLEEIEARLNDGCASKVALRVIGHDGIKLDGEALYSAQSGSGWCSSLLHKTRLSALLADGCSCVMHNCSQLNPRVEALIADVERLLPSAQADLHIYVSPRAHATGFAVHRDQPQHKLYLQLYGTTSWTLYRGRHPKQAMSIEEAAEALEVDLTVTLGPGALLYLPPGVYHHATNPLGPRVSLSIPFFSSPGSTPVDRTHLPLAALLRAGQPKPA